REALLGSVDESLDYYIGYYNNKTMAAWGPALDERGIERITYSDEAIAEFREAVAGPAAAAWIEENNARGLPAQDLYDFVIEQINK
ncbi:MAG: C4-dicarboxylate ABC transporter substrate-binding protein, partial [Halocynthiibacter sp.]